MAAKSDRQAASWSGCSGSATRPCAIDAPVVSIPAVTRSSKNVPNSSSSRRCPSISLVASTVSRSSGRGADPLVPQVPCRSPSARRPRGTKHRGRRTPGRRAAPRSARGARSPAGRRAGRRGDRRSPLSGERQRRPSRSRRPPLRRQRPGSREWSTGCERSSVVDAPSREGCVDICAEPSVLGRVHVQHAAVRAGDLDGQDRRARSRALRRTAAGRASHVGRRHDGRRPSSPVRAPTKPSRALPAR